MSGFSHVLYMVSSALVLSLSIIFAVSHISAQDIIFRFYGNMTAEPKFYRLIAFSAVSVNARVKYDAHIHKQ